MGTSTGSGISLGSGDFDSLADTPPNKAGADGKFLRVNEAQDAIEYSQEAPGRGIDLPDHADVGEVVTWAALDAGGVLSESDVYIQDGIIERITQGSRLWLRHRDTDNRILIGAVDTDFEGAIGQVAITGVTGAILSLIATTENSQFIECVKNKVSQGVMGARSPSGDFGLYRGGERTSSVHRLILSTDGAFLARGDGLNTRFVVRGRSPAFELRSNDGVYFGSLEYGGGTRIVGPDGSSINVTATGGFEFSSAGAAALLSLKGDNPSIDLQDASGAVVGSLAFAGGELVLEASPDSKLMMSGDGTEVLGKLAVGVLVPSEDYALLVAGAFGLQEITTEQRDALMVSDGAIIHHTETGKYEEYRGGVWKALGGVAGPPDSIHGEVAVYDGLLGESLGNTSDVAIVEGRIQRITEDANLVLVVEGEDGVVEVENLEGEQAGIKFIAKGVVTGAVGFDEAKHSVFFGVAGGQSAFGAMQEQGWGIFIDETTGQVGIGGESLGVDDGAGVIIHYKTAFMGPSLTLDERLALSDVPVGATIYLSDRDQHQRKREGGNDWNTFLEQKVSGAKDTIPVFTEDGWILKASEVQIEEGTMHARSGHFDITSNPGYLVRINGSDLVMNNRNQVGVGGIPAQDASSLTLFEPNKALILNQCSNLEQQLDGEPAEGMLAYQSAGLRGAYVHVRDEWKRLLTEEDHGLGAGFEVIVNVGQVEFKSTGVDVIGGKLAEFVRSQSSSRIQLYKRAGVEMPHSGVFWDPETATFTMPGDAEDGYYQCSIDAEGVNMGFFEHYGFTFFRPYISINDKHWPDITDVVMFKMMPWDSSKFASSMIHLKPGWTVRVDFDAYFYGTGSGEDWGFERVKLKINYVRPRT